MEYKEILEQFKKDLEEIERDLRCLQNQEMRRAIEAINKAGNNVCGPYEIMDLFYLQIEGEDD